MEDDFKDFVQDQLSALENITCRKMFDAHGLYYEGRFFGIVHKGTLYLKTNENTRKSYAAYGMKPFSPSEKQTLKNYYEIPSEILEQKEMLSQWAISAARI